jgi:hypothetical protein
MAKASKVEKEELDENIQSEKPSEKKGDTYIVAQEFRDINNFSKAWKKGHDVSHFDEKRLQGLVDSGHVVKK